VSRRRLLLADDSVTIQKVVNLTFADEGIEVFAVGDGNEAIDRLMEISPDLVMADINMPGLSGYQVCERIKNNDRFKNTPVILLVGSFEPFDEAEARRVGANDYLTKPFQSIRQLVSKVSELLESAENAQSSGSFAETQEIEQPVEAEASQYEASPSEAYEASQYEAPQYGDSEIDDEMIQASPASGFAFDEAQKFASRNYVEPREEDYGKTQPLSAADLKEIESAPDEDASAPQEQMYSGEVSPVEDASPAESDEDDDFLELFDDDEFEDEEEETEDVQPTAETVAGTGDVSGESQTPVYESEAAPTAETENAQSFEAGSYQPAETESAQSYETQNAQSSEAETEYTQLGEPESIQTDEVEAENVQPAETESAESNEAENAQTVEAESTQPTEAESVQPDKTEAMAASASNQLSPEMIDAIAQRVIEKLSASAVKEIAWEVVPQQADLIIKKMVEEKLKE